MFILSNTKKGKFQKVLEVEAGVGVIRGQAVAA
jgi:hypothetical protein